MAADWRSAYFLQARSDYAMLQLLMQQAAPSCQRLHYLQMTAEKLAKGFKNSLLPLAQEIEDLAPQGEGNQPNPEYPWQDGPFVIAPCEHDFAHLDFRSPKMIKMLQFIDTCLRIV